MSKTCLALPRKLKDCTIKTCSEAPFTVSNSDIQKQVRLSKVKEREYKGKAYFEK